MYNDAPKGRQVAMIHLFHLKFRDHIKKVGIRAVVQAANYRSTYMAEVNKGMNLADYADPKPDK